MDDGLFTPVAVGRISTEIVEQVKAAIRDGRLRPGDRLPPRHELMRRLGVSRVTVRDALHVLEACGLIELRVGAHGGAFVTAPAAGLVRDRLADALLLSDATDADVSEARSAVTGALLELACARRTDADLAALDGLCAESGGAWTPELRAAVARCAHSRALGLLAEILDGDGPPVDPRALADAIRERDAAAARALLDRPTREGPGSLPALRA